MTSASTTLKGRSWTPGSRNGQPPAASGPGRGGPGWVDRLPHSARQRRPAMVAGGLLLILLCGTVSAALVTRGDRSVAVLALARDVPAGQQLTAADLRTARLSGSGVSAVSASAATTVIGQSLSATLPAGTLLTSRMLNATSVPPAGQQLVALALKAGLVPAEVTAGRDVSLIAVDSKTAAGQTPGAAATVLVPRARVLSVHTDPSSGQVLMSVQVQASMAPAIVQADASGTIAVTLLPVTP